MLFFETDIVIRSSAKTAVLRAIRLVDLDPPDQDPASLQQEILAEDLELRQDTNLAVVFVLSVCRI